MVKGSGGSGEGGMGERVLGTNGGGELLGTLRGERVVGTDGGGGTGAGPHHRS